jgi:hypothetical protein
LGGKSIKYQRHVREGIVGLFSRVDLDLQKVCGGMMDEFKCASSLPMPNIPRYLPKAFPSHKMEKPPSSKWQPLRTKQYKSNNQSIIPPQIHPN